MPPNGSPSHKRGTETLARDSDCFVHDPECLHSLNATAGRDEVRWSEVMSVAKRLPKEQLYHGALIGAAWEERFASSYCETWRSVNFSGTEAATKRLRARLKELEASNGLEVLLVHADNLTDGIGARVKKAVELIAMALRVGFHGVAMAFPPAGALLQPAPQDWPHGACWCHDSPADLPVVQEQRSLSYEPICWRMDLQSDFFAQTPEPEGRVPLWGSEPPRILSSAQGANAVRFNCLRFSQPEDMRWSQDDQARGKARVASGDSRARVASGDSSEGTSSTSSTGTAVVKAARRVICGAIGSVLPSVKASSRWCQLQEREEIVQPPRDEIVEPPLAADSAWHFHKREGIKKKVMRRLFSSIRVLASPQSVLPGRREASCGYGGPAEVVHVAVHLRRGDVGNDSNYAVIQQLGASSFSEWLCALAAALGGRQLFLHVHTEALGRSRTDLQRGGLIGFNLEPHAEDDNPVFHTAATFEHPPICPAGSVFDKVHVAVNDSPREALLCMARADVLVTSFSSLGWTAAVLNGGLVLHPDAEHHKRQNVYWDLRSHYMNWATNWFRVSDVWKQPDALRHAFEEQWKSR